MVFRLSTIILIYYLSTSHTYKTYPNHPISLYLPLPYVLHYALLSSRDTFTDSSSQIPK